MNNTEVYGKKRYLQTVLEKAGNKGKILSAMIELLDKCNFHCEYCYVRGSSNSVISAEKVKVFLEQLRAEGCVWLTLTGGEPLLHPQFLEIYSYAYDLGFAVTVLTNGYLLSDEHVKMFQEKKPRVIDITLYGFNEETYSTFVGRKNAFKRFKSNLDLLYRNSIPFELKATLTTQTYQYLPEYEKFASNYGVNFRYDVMVLPGLKNSDCLNLRLSPEIAVSLQLKQPNYFEKVKQKFEESSSHPINNSVYRCAGGKGYVFISSNLKMGFCAFERKYQYDLNSENATIKDGHNWLINQRVGVLNPNDKCFDCELKSICKYCPARFELESGNQRIPPVWYCDCAKTLFKAIQNKGITS